LLKASPLVFLWTLGFSFLMWGDEEKGLIRRESLELLVGCSVATFLVASAFRFWIRRRGFWKTTLEAIALTYVGTIVCAVCSVVALGMLRPRLPGADSSREMSQALIELPVYAVMAATFYAVAAIPIGAVSVAVLRWADESASPVESDDPRRR
jgi:predicted permease